MILNWRESRLSNYIGPIITEKVHIRDGNETKRDGTETINLVCSVEQAHQLRGLCENSVKNTYGSLRILSTQESRWGILPVNTSENLKINEHQTHSGLYHVKDIEIEAIGNRDDIVIARIPVELLSKNVNEILTILHSRGGEDGSSIEMSEEYSDEEIEFLLEEEFTTFNTTTVWHPKYTENMATGADIVASAGKLVFSGASATNLTWSYLWTVLRETLPDDFEAEFTLEWNALPASGAVGHHMNLFLMDGKPANSAELQYKDTLRMVLDVQDTGAVISVDKRIRGNYSGISAEHSLTSSQKIIALKIKLEGGTGVSNLTVWIDKNYGGTGTPSYGDPIFGPANTGFNYDNEMYLILAMENASSTSATVRCSFLNISQTFDALKPNIVVAPVGAVADRTPDFYRTGEEGDIPCFKNPPTPPTFQIDPANFYKGSVKCMNSNYTDAVPRLVTDNEFSFDPTKLTLSNGLIRLVPAVQGVIFQYWNGTAWATLDTFTLPNVIRLIRPFLVTKDRFILQIDRTLWGVKSGSYGIWIKHPYDTIGYTLKGNYYHDGVVGKGLAGGADVSMLTQFYTLVFNPYNILTQNQMDVEADLAGFTAVGSTITQESGGLYGKYIKAITNNSTTYEGILLNMRTLPPHDETGLILSGRALLHGSGTCTLVLDERDAVGTLLGTASSSLITLNATPTLYNVPLIISSSNVKNVSLHVYTNVKQTATLNGDMFQIAPIPNSGGNLFSTAPYSPNRYGMFIIKTHPTTIKTNSIPASDLTGIGVYDQMQPSNADNGFLSLAREWFRPTWQTLLLQSEV